MTKAEIAEMARESWGRILNMDGGGPQATAAGLWASMYAEPLLNAARTPDPIIMEMVEALEEARDELTRLRDRYGTAHSEVVIAHANTALARVSGK